MLVDETAQAVGSSQRGGIDVLDRRRSRIERGRRTLIESAVRAVRVPGPLGHSVWDRCGGHASVSTIAARVTRCLEVGQDEGVRIVSLLPSATEVVYLLGLDEFLVGVTHECDWPPDARSKRQVSYSRIPHDATPSEIDRLVNESVSGGAPTHGLDHDAIRELAPDLVLTQDLCAVCAVPAGHLRAALDLLGISAEVVSLDPSSLDDVLGDVLAIGKATERESRAEEIAERLRERLARVRELVADRKRQRTFALEWGDPPFNAGHWVPEMIELAGGDALLASRGVPSVRVTWDEIARAQPETVVFMPCGYDLDGAMAQIPQLLQRPEIAGTRAVFAAGANGYYSRPGPRLVDGVEALAWAFHGEIGVTAAPGTLARVK